MHGKLAVLRTEHSVTVRPTLRRVACNRFSRETKKGPVNPQKGKHRQEKIISSISVRQKRGNGHG